MQNFNQNYSLSQSYNQSHNYSYTNNNSQRNDHNVRVKRPTSATQPKGKHVSHSPIRNKRPVSAMSPSAFDRLHTSQTSCRTQPTLSIPKIDTHISQFQSSHMMGSTALSPTHRNVYKRLIIDAVHVINCPILYRTLLKLEKAFQSDPKAKQRFVKMVYLSACQGDQEYDPLVNFLKQQMGVCISLAECRQLVLYSGLFGDTSSTTPSKENMKQVVNNMHLHVPQLFYYQKWCRDVKKLETRKSKPTTGYFSNKWKNTATGHNLTNDLSSVMSGDDGSKQSSHNNNSSHQEDQEPMTQPINSMPSSSPYASSRHLAMLQAIANGEEDDDELIPPPPKPKQINRFKKIALSLVAVGSDLTVLTNEVNAATSTSTGINNHTPFQTTDAKRRQAHGNVYMVSENPEYRKLIATLARGDSSVSPTGEIVKPLKPDNDNTWTLFPENGDEHDDHDIHNVNSPSNMIVGSVHNRHDVNAINIFNIKGDPIKDGYYVNASSRVEVLNFLDPKYMEKSSTAPGTSQIVQRTPTSQKLNESTPTPKNNTKFPPKIYRFPSSEINDGKGATSSQPQTNESSPAKSPTIPTSAPRRLSKTYSQTLLDEDESTIKDDTSSVASGENPFASPAVTTKGGKKVYASKSKGTSPNSNPLSEKLSPKINSPETSLTRTSIISIADDADESYNIRTPQKPMTSSPKKGVKFQSSFQEDGASTRFLTSVTVGLAKLRLLKKIRSPGPTQNDSLEPTPTPPNSEVKGANQREDVPVDGTDYSSRGFQLTRTDSLESPTLEAIPSLTNLMTLYNPDNSFMLNPEIDSL